MGTYNTIKGLLDHYEELSETVSRSAEIAAGNREIAERTVEEFRRDARQGLFESMPSTFSADERLREFGEDEIRDVASLILSASTDDQREDLTEDQRRVVLTILDFARGSRAGAN